MSISISSSYVINTPSLVSRHFPHPSSMPSVRLFRILLATNTSPNRLRSANCSGISSPESSNLRSNFAKEQGSSGKGRNLHGISPNDILNKLKRYGVSGMLSYGLLNTAYYITTFLVVWLYVAPSPGRMGYLAAVERFLKVMAMVWAGSQVTKLLRAGGALALAPFIDRGLSWFTIKFGFESHGKASIAIVGVCFGLAFLTFIVVTVLWA